MTVLTMDRNGIFRFYQGVDQLDFLLAGMSGNMDILENNLGSFIDSSLMTLELPFHFRGSDWS